MSRAFFACTATRKCPERVLRQPLEKDGDKDLLLKFLSYDARIAKGMTEACVKGAWVDAAGIRRTFFGCDSIRTTN